VRSKWPVVGGLVVTAFVLTLAGSILASALIKSPVVWAGIEPPPTPRSLSRIVIVAGPGGFEYVPRRRDRTRVRHEVLQWLRQSEPVFALVPRSATGNFAEYFGPPSLGVWDRAWGADITPATWMTVNAQGQYTYHYVPGVVVFQQGWRTIYLRAPALDAWLKNSTWEPSFQGPP
jgi:hypothetical protein